MTSLLGCKLGSRIAAIAPVSGLRLPGPGQCSGRPVPVLTFHGLADPQNTYDGHAAGRGEEWLESVPEALAGWARHDSCKGDAILEDPPGPLSTMRYEGCPDGGEVRMIRIDGLGHTWTRRKSTRPAVMLAVLQEPSSESISGTCRLLPRPGIVMAAECRHARPGRPLHGGVTGCWTSVPPRQ